VLDQQRRIVRSRLANATARAVRDPQAAAEVEDLRREYRYLSAEDYIKRVVDEAPPLSPYQRDALALLLRPSGGAAA